MDIQKEREFVDLSHLSKNGAMTQFKFVRNTMEELLVELRDEINKLLGKDDFLGNTNQTKLQKSMENIRGRAIGCITRWVSDYTHELRKLVSYYEFFENDEIPRFIQLANNYVNLSNECKSWFTPDYIKNIRKSIDKARDVYKNVKHTEHTLSREPFSYKTITYCVTERDCEAMIEACSLLIQFREKHLCDNALGGDRSVDWSDEEREKYKETIREQFNFFYKQQPDNIFVKGHPIKFHH